MTIQMTNLRPAPESNHLANIKAAAFMSWLTTRSFAALMPRSIACTVGTAAFALNASLKTSPPQTALKAAMCATIALGSVAVSYGISQVSFEKWIPDQRFLFGEGILSNTIVSLLCVPLEFYTSHAIQKVKRMDDQSYIQVAQEEH